MTEHPFPHDVITTVADEHEVDPTELDQILEQVQEAIQRGDETYEYSSQHTFGWEDTEAFYLYGDGIWATLEDELSLAQRHVAPARAVHRTHMVDSARQRGEDESVIKQFDEGTEALVVANTAEGDPLFGQEI